MSSKQLISSVIFGTIAGITAGSVTHGNPVAIFGCAFIVAALFSNINYED